jgi:hypothetical protein
MRKLGSHRPSPAMIVACIALIVAVGGSAYAATKIGTKQLKNGAVSTKKLKNNAVKEPKIGGGAVTSAKIKDGTIATIDVAGCKAGTELVNGSCFDSSPRPAATWFEATDACGAAGGSLPTVSEILATRNHPGFDLGVLGMQSSHWGSDVFDDAGTTKVLSVSDTGGVSLALAVNAVDRVFRCVYDRL